MGRLLHPTTTTPSSTAADTLGGMGRAGEKRKGPKHLPKVGTRPENEYAIRHERQAVEEILGIRPGSTAALILGAVLVFVAAVAIIGFIALR